MRYFEKQSDAATVAKAARNYIPAVFGGVGVATGIGLSSEQNKVPMTIAGGAAGLGTGMALSSDKVYPKIMDFVKKLKR